MYNYEFHDMSVYTFKRYSHYCIVDNVQFSIHDDTREKGGNVSKLKDTQSKYGEINLHMTNSCVFAGVQENHVLSYFQLEQNHNRIVNGMNSSDEEIDKNSKLEFGHNSDDDTSVTEHIPVLVVNSTDNSNDNNDGDPADIFSQQDSLNK